MNTKTIGNSEKLIIDDANIDFYENNPDYVAVHEPIEQVIGYLQKLQESKLVFA